MRKNDFIINGLIGYNKCKGIIYNLTDPSITISLQNPANQCLSILLEKQPEIVNQDYLFHHVWEKNGLPTNANTLYQSISLIRKAFKAAGIEENIIKTVPRLGLTIPEDIDVQIVTEESEQSTQNGIVTPEENSNTLNIPIQDSESALPFSSPFTETLSQQATSNTSSNQSSHYSRYFIGLLLFIVAAISVYLSMMHKQSNVFSDFSFYTTYKNCQLYTLNDHKALNDIIKTINRLDISCDNESTIYYATIHNSYRESLIQCTNGSCISFYYFDARKDIREN